MTVKPLQLLLGLLLAATGGAEDSSMPAPFYRELYYDSASLMEGNDVTIAQTLLNRAPSTSDPLSVDGEFGSSTADAVSAFQAASADPQLTETGKVDADTAQALLDCCMEDGYVDDGVSAGAQGYLYKFIVPVHTNRSVETTAQLLDENNTQVMEFRVRCHGYRDDGTSEAWPDYGDGDVGLNMLSSNGNTPTVCVCVCVCHRCEARAVS